MERHAYLDHDGPIAFAHRGGQDAAPENTLASFEHAVALGYRYLETDVHLTRDGVLVAFHDSDLMRTCGIDAKIAEMTAAEVDEARVDGEHRIPLMSELFEHFPDARFNIDAKSDETVEPLGELVRSFDALPRVCLASFKLSRLRRLRSILGSELLTNMSAGEVASLRLTGRLLGDTQRVAQVPVDAGRVTVVTKKFLDNSRARGIAVHVWTINDRQTMEGLVDLGVDGIMTDDCALLRDVLVERNLWPGI